ncbi:hypothetical protein DXG01_012491 [Tephrocybe rancida]|nr:hypothetical protein DXG01_012491 [Tephrocybe rancida]
MSLAPSMDDPFLPIPGSWPTKQNSSDKGPPVFKNIPTQFGRHTMVTPRKLYRAPRRVIESSDSEGSDAHRLTTHTVIELSDSSPERENTTRQRQPMRLAKASVSEDELFDSDSDEENTHADEGAILTLDEPKSARTPLRLPSQADIAPAPVKRLQLVRDSEKSLTLEAASSTQENTLASRKAAYSLPASVTPVSTTKATGTKPRGTPRISKKAQAAAEQERRELYARKLFDELNHTVFGDKLPKETKLNWSKRLLTTAGRAKWHRDGIQTTEIELAEKILDCDERIRNTLSHEMCHLASWIIDASPKEVHGRIFKAWSDKIMRKRPEIEITTRHDYEIGFKFNWKCLKCAKTYGRHSKSIDVTKVVCGACREGRLAALFETRAARTPKTSKQAAAKPQDSPQLLPPQASDEAHPASSSTTSIDRIVYTIHDSDSEPEVGIEMLTTAMGLVTFVD